MKAICGFLLAGAICVAASAEPVVRVAPRPLVSHPGNVFLAGEDVILSLGGRQAAGWQLLDYEDHVVATPQVKGQSIQLGRLPVGFYRLQRQGESNWTSLAVLTPLRVPIPLDSPVALDVAMAWFYPKEKMDEASSLCVLAGVNWVRDRLSWSEVEPQKGRFAESNRYDASARSQSQAGLRVLQVAHASPAWATKTQKRFPPDLRDAYSFYRAMARRWHGQVMAFEPWNEADIEAFGGHTGSEMASMQKASYLGLKAGAPDVTACLNVFAMHNKAQLADLHDNQAWPYLDTFNLHHYVPFEDYPGLYADFRAVSAGRALWVSECALPVKWSGDPQLHEPSVADSRTLAERVAKVFACSLHEGSVATFYFLLPHYIEGQTQFGLLRPDLTPRPGYLALAAVGRLLSNAHPLGRLQSVPEAAWGGVFAAEPDGEKSEVLVAWSGKGETSIQLPVTPRALFDHLGRPLPLAGRLSLSSAPVFAVLPPGSASRLALEPPPQTPPRLAGAPSPVVLQALWPQDSVSLAKSAYRLPATNTVSVLLAAYNFGEDLARGALSAAVPAGWQASGLGDVELPPLSRVELRLKLKPGQSVSSKRIETVRVTGDFSAAGQSVLSMRVIPTVNPSLLTDSQAIPEAKEKGRWQPMISGGGLLEISESDQKVLFTARPEGSDRWVYPRLTLPGTGRAGKSCVGLLCSITVLEGQGKFRAIFDEINGSSYLVDFEPPVKEGETFVAVAWFENAVHGHSWSKEDPNSHLDPDQIVSLKIGCNTTSKSVKYSVGDLGWLKF